MSKTYCLPPPLFLLQSGRWGVNNNFPPIKPPLKLPSQKLCRNNRHNNIPFIKKTYTYNMELIAKHTFFYSIYV